MSNPSTCCLRLVLQEDGIVRAIITKVSGGTQAIQQELSNELDKRPNIQGASLEASLSGQTVEDQVNRLKTIKHQMYCRANFDQLRKRVLGPH